MKTNQNLSGFTLIELLVVVLIIGILVSVAVPQYAKTVTNARVTQIYTAAKKIAEAEQRYYLENNTYTADPKELDVQYPLSADGTSFQFPKGSCLFSLMRSVDDMYKRVQCAINPPLITLLQYVHQEALSCISYPEDQYKGDFFCQQLTGTVSWYNGCSQERVCHVYTHRG